LSEASLQISGFAERQILIKSMSRSLRRIRIAAEKERTVERSKWKELRADIRCQISEKD